MAEEELRAGEEAAANGGEADFSSGHKTNVTGAVAATKGGKLKSLSIKTFGVIVAVIALVLLFVTPIYAIDAISTRLIEETDVQYADAVQSKALVFQNALENGEIPENTFERLQQEGVEVGYMDGDNFVASRFGQTVIAANNSSDAEIIYKQCTENCTALSIKLDDGTVIPASQFYYEVNHNVKLYNAFNNSTYSRAAYYYDEEAQRVFREIGTSRNNYGGDDDFETVMNNIMGTGHSFGVNNETWHYMPHWALDNIKDPGSAYIHHWTTEVDDFNCQGTSNGRQIPYWNNYMTVWHGIYDEKGNLIDYYYSIHDVAVADSSYGCTTSSSDGFITTLAQSNMTDDGNSVQTTLNTIDSLKVTDTVSKEKRSMLLYAGIAESFSRTKAGYGSTNSETKSILAAVATIGASTGGGADVNDVMNWLYDTQTTTMPSIYGGTATSTGSALESPSLYAVLTGEKIEANTIENYTSDRIIKRSANLYRAVDTETMKKTMTSVGTKMTGNVDRYTLNNVVDNDKNETGSGGGIVTASVCFTDVQGNDGVKATPLGYDIKPDCNGAQNRNTGDSATIQNVANDMIDQSLYTNSFDTIKGINAGEMLVEGAVNLGKALAQASGSSAGTKDKVNKYLAVTADVLAMDAAADRLNRSPLDITSRNTFLGSIVYKFAVSTIKSGSILNKVASTSRVLANAAKSLLPAANAEDTNEDLYLSVHGDCDTLDSIGAVGSGTCSAIATFDTSTYNDPYGAMNSGWLSDNVTCSGSTCTPKEGSKLEEYINFVELRETPMGITDGQIVEVVESNSNSGGGILKWFKRAISNLLTRVANVLGASKEVVTGEKEVPDEATGKTYVVGGSDWDDYKLAQRYISLARAAETMRQYDGDETAYNFTGFGLGNPIARYIEEHSEDTIAVSE